MRKLLRIIITQKITRKNFYFQTNLEIHDVNWKEDTFMLNCLNTSKESYHLWCMAKVGHQMEAVHYNLTIFHYFPVFLSHESICFQDPVDKMTVHYWVIDGIWIKRVQSQERIFFHMSNWNAGDITKQNTWSLGRNKTPISYERIISCWPFFSKVPQAALDKFALKIIKCKWGREKMQKLCINFKTTSILFKTPTIFHFQNIAFSK